ncbi:hypothetical protein MASR2M69_03080 [Bacteroidota bacterium]
MKFLVLIIIITFTFGCNSDKINDFIDLDKEDKVSIYDLIDSISVVQLETKRESLIKSPCVLFYKNKYYVFDHDQQKVFCFDSNGKYLFKIDKKGRGGDEYSYAANMEIDTFNDMIMLLVPWGNLVCYDLNGKFISKIRLPETIRSYNEVFALDKDRLVFISHFNNYKVFIYSRTTGNIDGFLPTTNDLDAVIPPIGKTYFYNDSLYFLNVGTETSLVNLTDKTLRSVFKWNFGDKNYNKKQIDELVLNYKTYKKERRSGLSRDEMFRNNKFPKYYISSISESDKFRILRLHYKEWGGVKINVFVDKTTDKKYVFRYTKEGIHFSGGIFYNKTFCSSLKTVSPEIKKIMSPEQLKIVDNHNPDVDNPYFIFYHFK